MPMIAKDLMPWMFVKRTDGWTPYVKIRSEVVRAGGMLAPAPRPARKPGRKPPRG